MNPKNIKHFVLDVDGVMTTGQFIYTADGKVAKIFGAHDADGLKLIRDKVQIQFITADKRGYDITKKRIVDDMGYKLTLVSESERYKFIEELGFDSTIFMGDGYFDAPIIKKCALGIAPANARAEAIKAADFTTHSRSAEGAVMDACLYIKEILNE